MTLEDSFALHAHALTQRLKRRFLRWRVVNAANDNQRPRAA